MASEVSKSLIARELASRYANFLSGKITSWYNYEKVSVCLLAKSSDCGLDYLIWMCREIIKGKEDYDNWSDTKLHRWIGYIQGVLIARGFSTVTEERENYKSVKKVLLEELGIVDINL